MVIKNFCEIASCKKLDFDLNASLILSSNIILHAYGSKADCVFLKQNWRVTDVLCILNMRNRLTKVYIKVGFSPLKKFYLFH